MATALASEVKPQGGGGHRIVIVDDDDDILESLEDLLSLNGYSVKTASDAESAQAVAEAFRPDVALLDIRLGQANGLDLLPGLQKRFPGIVCIMMTAFAETDSAVQAVRRGANDYLYKPMDPKNLIEVLDHHIADQRREREKRRLVVALRKREEQLRQVVDHIREVFWIKDIGNGAILYASPAFAEVWGRPCDQLFANRESFLSAIHPEDRSEIAKQLASPSLDEHELEYRIHRPDGTMRWLCERAFPVRNQAGKIYRIAAIVEDITDRKMAEQRVRRMAHQDALTGLPNRNLLHGRLERTISRAKRFGRKFGVGMLDLDNFKPINDKYGREMGDAVLKVVATRLLSSVRAVDTVARVGGDEFILVIEEANDRSDLKRVAERILAMVTRPIQVDGNTCSIGISLGFSVYPDDGENVEVLTRNADTAMYEVKSKGRNGYRFFKAVPPEGAR